MYGLLKGLRVIELSAFVAAPLGGMTLAQLGAEVIRVDPIGGGIDFHRWPVAESGHSLYWAGLNKGKRSVTIDLKSEAGRALACALITAPGPDAGLLLTNFPTTGWLAYETLAQTRADLILVNVQGNPDGSSAVDYTINCATGIPYATGSATPDEPVNHMLPAWDALTGMHAALALLAAERQRSRTGAGQLVRIALADVAFAMLGNLGHIAESQVNGQNRPALGNFLYGAFGRDFSTRDGRRVMIVAITRRQWRVLLEATGLAEACAAISSRRGVDLEEEGGRFVARDDIAQVLQAWCTEKTLEQVREQFDSTGVCWGTYQTFTELVNSDPRIGSNPVFEYREQPGVGSYYMPGSPIRFDDLRRLPVAPAPLLGEDTDEVLSTVLGMSSAEIRKLHARRVIAGPVA